MENPSNPTPGTYRGIKPLVFCSKRTNVDVLIGRDSAATLISDVDTIRRCSVTFKVIKKDHSNDKSRYKERNLQTLQTLLLLP